MGIFIGLCFLFAFIIESQLALLKNDDPPEFYDARLSYGDMLFPAFEMGACVSDWAAMAIYATSIRNAKAGCGHKLFSIGHLLSCDRSDMQCEGGYPKQALLYIQDNGIPLDSCIKYNSANSRVPPCSVKCDDNSTMTKYYPISGVDTLGNDLNRVMLEIMTAGPVVGVMTVYNDFHDYVSGVYINDKILSWEEGPLSVLLMGWGIDEVSNNKYWLCLAPYGPDFGDKGYFKILRGSNHCGIEQTITGGKVNSC